MSSATQYVEFSTQSGTVSKISSSATRWEQGTCNKRFKDEAGKIGQKKSMSNGKKVSFALASYSYILILILLLDTLEVAITIVIRRCLVLCLSLSRSINIAG